MIHATIVDASRVNGVKRLLYLGSSCIYPRECPQPIREEYLLSGPLEPTNEPYAIAKISGIRLCQAYRRQYGCDFISAMPTNLYGPGDNFDLDRARTSCRRSCASSTRPRYRAPAAPSSGAPARRAASSCMSTISPTRASS